jgi:L-2-hydroxyglutarate oxidase LhgO
MGVTRMKPLRRHEPSLGTDVNFGSLTRSMIEWIHAQEGVTVHLNHRVHGPNRGSDERWRVNVQNKADGTKRTLNTNFVFLGAGGGALPLLQKSDIAESKGFGGFPVSGQWLRCDKVEVVDRHNAKVYGKARSAHRRCRFRTSTREWLMARDRCSLVRMQASPPSS